MAFQTVFAAYAIVLVSCSTHTHSFSGTQADNLSEVVETVADLSTLLDSLDGGSWHQQPGAQPRLSGATVDGVEYAVHGRMNVYFTRGVQEWLAGARPLIPDGSAVVAIEYASDPQMQPARMLLKVKQQAASRNGWLWSSTSLAAPADAPVLWTAGDSSCLVCHASAERELTFLDGAGPPSTAGYAPGGLRQSDAPAVERRLPDPLPQANAGFLEYFDQVLASEGHAPLPPTSQADFRSFPGPETDDLPPSPPFITSSQCRACHDASQLLSSSSPNMWHPDPEGGGGDVFRNYSPYGEWSASVNALAGRDPIWHAAVETERFVRPAVADYAVDACFSCHGPMGGRQLKLDRATPENTPFFEREMFYATEGPDAKYGALARDGVSCSVCHTIDAAGLGVDPDFDPEDPHKHLSPDQLQTYTALFKTNAQKLVYGPFAERVHDGAMRQALGVEARHGPLNAVDFPNVAVSGQPFPKPAPAHSQTTSQLTESKLCGSCHTVLVPALPVGYEPPRKPDGELVYASPAVDPSVPISFEQTTYFEWRNSIYENETKTGGLSCQGCHMPQHRNRSSKLLRQRIANIESSRFPPVQGRVDEESISLATRAPYRRHVLLGINLFLDRMYQEFPDILGSQPEDSGVPENTVDSLLTAADWVADHAKKDTARVQVLRADEDGEGLGVDVEVTNFGGHKLPTGAGFRRAFIRLRVFDASGSVLWSSGRTNAYGVLLDGAGRTLASEMTRNPLQSQPHHQVITREDQVQIYETRSLDQKFRREDGSINPVAQLQTTVLGIVDEYKDNRILPLGWRTGEGRNDPPPADSNLFATEPRLPDSQGMEQLDDPDYFYDEAAGNDKQTQEGHDRLTYRIPLERIRNWAVIDVQLMYQTIPPYYLRDRFVQGVDPSTGELGEDTKRLLFILSRLDLEGTSAFEDWSMPISNRVTWERGRQPPSPEPQPVPEPYAPPAMAGRARSIDHLMGVNGYEAHAQVLEGLPYETESGKRAGWQDYASWGHELFYNGSVKDPPSGQVSRPLSAVFTCAQCHNDQREDPILVEQDPEARFEYIQAQIAAAAERSQHLKMTQGVTMWGAVNRTAFYNGIYSAYHGLKVPTDEAYPDPALSAIKLELAQIPEDRTRPGIMSRFRPAPKLPGGEDCSQSLNAHGRVEQRRRMDPTSLSDASQVCSEFCSVGRYMNEWELNALLTYYWDLELSIDDLDLTPEMRQRFLSELGDVPDQPTLSQVVLRNELASHYLNQSSETRRDEAPAILIGEAGESAARAGDYEADLSRGRELYKLSCAYCHGVGDGLAGGQGGSFLAGSKYTYYEALKNGFFTSLCVAYMPEFTTQRLSDTQAHDILGYLAPRDVNFAPGQGVLFWIEEARSWASGSVVAYARDSKRLSLRASDGTTHVWKEVDPAGHPLDRVVLTEEQARRQGVAAGSSKSPFLVQGIGDFYVD